MAQTAWMTAIPERFERDRLISPRLPPLSEIARYDHYTDAARDRRMADYNMSSAKDSYYSVDPAAAAAAAYDAQRAPAYTMSANSQYSPNFELYPQNPPEINTFASSRYRQNASSSSSLSTGYPLSPDSLYSASSSYTDGVAHAYNTPPASATSYELPRVSSFSSAHESPPLSATAEHMPYLPDGSVPEYSVVGTYPEHARRQQQQPQQPQQQMSNGYAFHEDYTMSHTATSGQFGAYEPAPMPERPFTFAPAPAHADAGSLHAVAPQDTGLVGLAAYDGYAGSAHTDAVPSADEPGARLPGDTTSFEAFMRPYLDQYMRTPNRLALGERSIIVMSSKVAQKSYGSERRFLCPPPSAVLIGNAWWTDAARPGEDTHLLPPRVVVSISDETTPAEQSTDWCTASGRGFDAGAPPPGTTYVGRTVGKQLFISDFDEKRKRVEALAQVIAPAGPDGVERVIGTFPSKPIKVISKPSKKRQNAKNLDLCVHHGSTVSLFHRLRAQTVSTKYLCVSGSTSAYKGSDGAPLVGLDSRARAATPSFVARTSSWDAFIIYIVDVHKAPTGLDTPPPVPPQPDYPSPPPNAIPCAPGGGQIPIYYNQTVVLQCLASGVVSPVLVIRRIDHDTTIVGGGAGGPVDGARAAGDAFCPPGEVCGDPVSQLHKVAFEVHDPARGPPAPGTPGTSGAFLSCMGEKVNTYRPMDGRTWAPGAFESPLGSPHTPPLSASASWSSVGDYFADASNGGGRVRKGKRSASSAGGLAKGPAKGPRRRPTSAGSMGSAGRQMSGELGGAPSSLGAQWQIDTGETSVWTIVGVDQVRYDFYIPPVLFDGPRAPQMRSFPIPRQPITPFPRVVKVLSPDRAAEVPRQHQRTKPAPGGVDEGKMLTLYGENFVKGQTLGVWFGAEPAPYVEVRCSEVVGCLPPAPSQQRRPVFLVRGDGVIFPSAATYA